MMEMSRTFTHCANCLSNGKRGVALAKDADGAVNCPKCGWPDFKPTPVDQKRIAGPAIDQAIAKGFDYRTMSVIMGVSAKALKDVHEGRGCPQSDWAIIKLNLKS